MSALGSLVVKLALEHAEYTQGLDKSDQAALKFAQNAQKNFDQASASAREFLGNIAGNVAGAIVSVVGLNAAFSRITESINILNSLDDAAQKTGSSIEDLSRIEQVARNFGDAFAPIDQGLTRLAKGLAEIDDPSSNAIRALNAIGVSARDSNGELRTAADVYIDVARSLQQYEDGTKKTAIAQALFGKTGSDLMPAINNLAQGIDHVTAVTAANASQAALFNDHLALGKARVTGFFTSLAVDLLPTLNNIASAFNNSTGQINSFSVVSTAASAVLKGLAIGGFTVADTFRGMGREIGARAAQLSALASRDFSGAKFIGQALAEDNAKSRAEYDKFVDTILNGEQKIAQAVAGGGTQKVIDFQVKLPAAVDAATKSIEKQTKAFDLELVKLKQYESEAKRARDITDSVATKQERYNQTLEELERLKPYLSVEAYTRALDKAQRELQDVGTVNRQVTTEMDQLWIQAGRNIQSTLANSIFDFFTGGLDGMVRNVKNAVLRIMSEFAALKLSQSIGLDRMFSMGGVGGAGAVSTGGNLLNMASLGSSAMNLVKGGFGLNSLIGGGLSSVGGSGLLGSFGAGMSGGSSAAAFIGAESATAGAGMAAGMGAAFAAAAGPLMIAAAATAGLKALAGDKRMGGGFGKFMNTLGDIPILGDFMPVVPLLNSLFGRGPLKQQGTSLSGEIGAEGFESGFLQTRFKAKGGLFRSDKIDFARVDALTGETSTDNSKLQGFADDLAKAAREVFGLINDTTKQTSDSLRQIGQDLGLSTEGIDKFSYSINLLSDKGKMLTEEQIGQEIERITEGLAHKLMPQVDALAKRGETAMQTVARLGAEFNALEQGAINLGASAAYAKEIVGNLSLETRTAYVDAAGGTEEFLNLTSKFSQNFLTEAERMAPMIKFVEDGLIGLGISADISKDAFGDLIQTLIQSASDADKATALLLLQNQDVFLSVNNYKEAQKQLNNSTLSLVESERSLLDVRNELNATYQKERSEIEATVSRFKDIASQLKDFRQGLLLSDLSPLTPGQRLNEARNQFNQIRSRASAGDETALSQLPNAAQSFLQASQAFNASSGAFVSDFNLVQDVLKNSESSALSQIEVARNQLDALDSSVDYLIDIESNTETTADLIRKLNIQTLNGPGNDSISKKDIQDFFAVNPNLTAQQIANAATKYGVSKDQLIDAGFRSSAINQFTGGATVSDKEISDFVNSGASPRQIYDAATENGISSARLSEATGLALNDINKWVRDNGLPSFDKGGIVKATGLAMVHKAERVINPQQNEELVNELKALRKENAELLKKVENKLTELTNVTLITNKQNAEVIAKSNQDLAKNSTWRERSRARLK